MSVSHVDNLGKRDAPGGASGKEPSLPMQER